MPENFSFNFNSYYKILKNRGIKSVFDEIKDNLFFDLINGTSTQLREGFSNNDYKHYAPAYTSLIKSSFNALKIDFAESVFVDLGSGKGKVTLISSKFKFKKIIGIELKKSLIETAEKNSLIFFNKLWNKKYKQSIMYINCDAVDYSFKGNENVFFMFDPFTKIKLKKIINLIYENKLKYNREIYIIFFNPPNYLESFKNKLLLQMKINRNTYSSFIYKLT